MSALLYPFQAHAFFPKAHTIGYASHAIHFEIRVPIPRIPHIFDQAESVLKGVILINISKKYDALKLNYFQISDDLGKHA